MCSVSQRGVAFFRDQELSIEEQKLLGTKLGELTGKPESSKLHVHPITEETSERGDEISVISSERNGQYVSPRTDRSTFAAYVLRSITSYDDLLIFCRISSASWHADITFEPIPSDYAILKVHTLPKINGHVTGGDTLWASCV